MPRIAVALYIALSVGRLFAFNHPEIQWKSVSTKHFHIHYYDKTEPAVYATWKIAEECYATLSSLYSYRLTEKINIALADYDDYSNGWASWTDRSIMIWTPDARFELRGNTTWLRNVIAHELTHIISMEKESGMQLLNWTFAAEYRSPVAHFSFAEPVPTAAFMPMWFAEGAAQMGADRTGNDCWDARRDMVLRCAILSGSQLSLAEMGRFTHDAVGNEMVYNQGYSLAAFLERRIGADTIARIWREARERKLFGKRFKALVMKHANLSDDQLYSHWLDSLQHYYQNQIPAEVTSVEPVWESGAFTLQPKVSPDGEYWGWLTSHRDDFGRTDLVIAPYGTVEPAARIPYAHTSWDFDPGGRRVCYIKSRNPDKHGSFLNDIFAMDYTTGNEIRLTHSARVYDIAFAPDGQSLACVRFDKGAFSLQRFDLRRKAFTVIDSGRLGDPFIAPRFAPHSSDSLVVTRLSSGKAGLFLVDLNAQTVEPLLDTDSQEERPFWANDGRIYFSADYSGIFDIYSIRPDGTEMHRHSRTPGGAFEPFVSADGSMLISEYTAHGFRIGRLSPVHESCQPAGQPECSLSPLPVPGGAVRIKASSYEPTLLRPAWEMFSTISLLDYAHNAPRLARQGFLDSLLYYSLLSAATGLSFNRSDALGKRSMYAGAAGVIVTSPMYATSVDSAEPNNVQQVSIGLDRRRIQTIAAPRGRCLPEQKCIIDQAATRGELRRANDVRFQSTETDSARDTTLHIQPLPLIVPFGGLQNRTAAVTYGIDLQFNLVQLIPAFISATPYIEHHVSRDWYWGVASIVQLAPLALLGGHQNSITGSLPIWVYWSRNGYLNEDYGYNVNGMSSVQAMVSPECMPVWDRAGTSRDTVLSADSSFTTTFALSAGLTASHGFPIFSRYASLRLTTSENVLVFANDEIDQYGVLAGRENTYVHSVNSARFIFPVWRDINRGRNYLDNLYGSIGYSARVYGNSAFLRAFDFSDETAVDIRHEISASLELGMVKHYFFRQRFTLSGTWEPGERNYTFSVTFH